MKYILWASVPLWIVGAILRIPVLVDLFGIVSIGVILIMLGRMFLRRLRASSGGADTGSVDLSIVSMHGVHEADRDPIERAIQVDAFKRLAADSSGRDIISVQTPTQDYLAVVSVEHGAILIYAAYRVSASDFEETLSSLREA